jgi:hypothetical protein
MTLFSSQIYDGIRSALRWMAFIVMVIGLQACPYSSKYFLDTNPQNQVNENYFGKWQGEWINPSGLKKPMQLDISRIDDYHYELIFHGNFFTTPKQKKCLFSFLKKKKKKTVLPVEDTIRCSAYASYINERELLNISIQGTQYFAELIFKDDRLTILPIDEGFSSKVILSDDELREAMEFHYYSHLNPSYDESMCLREMTRRTDP